MMTTDFARLYAATPLDDPDIIFQARAQTNGPPVCEGKMMSIIGESLADRLPSGVAVCRRAEFAVIMLGVRE